jgi:hypothetical protein
MAYIIETTVDHVQLRKPGNGTTVSEKVSFEMPSHKSDVVSRREMAQE